MRQAGRPPYPNNTMAFNPLLPANGSLISAPELRSQFNGLRDEIAAGSITGAQVDSTNTGAPGNPATAGVTLSAGVLHFDFTTIPAGQDGEVTQAQLSNDLANNSNYDLSQAMAVSSNNSNGVSLLGVSVSDPPTQAEVQSIANKLDELITGAAAVISRPLAPTFGGMRAKDHSTETEDPGRAFWSSPALEGLTRVFQRKTLLSLRRLLSV
jgi:hypothetical protein